MANFPIHTPTRTQSKVGEGSSLRPARDSNAPGQAWKKNNQYAEQINALSELIKGTARWISSLKTQISGVSFHPFKIYQWPQGWRQVTGDSNDWMKVRVRGGNVITSKIDNTTTKVIGTDGIDWPDRQIFPYEISGSTYDTGSGSGSLDILVPANTPAYYFWIESSGSNYYVRHSDVPTSASTPNNPNPWTVFPTVDGTHTIIGYANTQISASSHQLFVRQFLRTDVMGTGGGTVNLTVCDPITGVSKTYSLIGTVSGSV